MNTNVLVICGDIWHPAAKVRQGINSLRAFDFNFEFAEGGEMPNRNTIGGFPIVVLARANVDHQFQPWLTEKSSTDFPEHVRRGNALVVLHGGMARYEHLPTMNSLFGGSFLHHPKPCAVILEPTGHSNITKNLPSFSALDEQYFVDTRSDVHIFLQSRSQHGVQPAGWTREEGKGRVCVLTPGHTSEMWAHPQFQKLLLNALQWAVHSR